MLKKAIDFVKHGVWEKPESPKGEGGWLVRPFKIIVYTVSGIGRHKITVRSAALTYYTVMSVVPIFAVVFGVLKGIGFDANVQQWLYGLFPNFTDAIDQVIIIVNRLLERTRGGILAGIGLFIFVWSIIQVFNNIESAFNEIWEVRKSRSFVRKLRDYTVILIVAPVLLVASVTATTTLKNLLLNWSWVYEVISWLLALGLMGLLFSLVYFLVPNTRVKYRGAFIAGMIAGPICLLFQKIYFLIQGELSAYNAIYGTFAAIPLFLIWMATTWQITLIGGELSFAYQNIGRYESERRAERMNLSIRRKVLVATMVVIIKHYLDKQSAVDPEDIALELDMPVRVVRDMIFDLEDAGLVVPLRDEKDSKDNLYIPARDVGGITVADVINGVEGTGEIAGMNGMTAMQKVSRLLDRMKVKAFDKELNKPLVELI